MVKFLLDCVKADREGNWNLYNNVVKRMILYCVLFNHYNYFQGCVMYLDDMSDLPLELENAFQQGHFSVKKIPAKFNPLILDSSWFDRNIIKL